MALPLKRGELYVSGTLTHSTSLTGHPGWRDVLNTANAARSIPGYMLFSAPLGNGDPSDTVAYPLDQNPGMVAKLATGSRAWMPAGLDGNQYYWELTCSSAYNHAKFYEWLIQYLVGNTQAQNRAAAAGYMSGVWQWPSARQVVSNGRVNLIQVKQGESFNTNSNGYAIGGGNSDPIFEIAAMRRSDIPGHTGAGPCAVFRHNIDNQFVGGSPPAGDVYYHGSGGGATPIDIPLDTPFALSLVLTTTGVHPYIGTVVYNPFSVTWQSLTGGNEVTFSHIGVDAGGYAFGDPGRRSFIGGWGNYSNLAYGTLDLLDRQTGPTQAPTLLGPSGGSTPPIPPTGANGFVETGVKEWGTAASVTVQKRASATNGRTEKVSIWWDGQDKQRPPTPPGWVLVDTLPRVGFTSHMARWIRIARTSDDASGTTFTFPEPDIGTISIALQEVYDTYLGVDTLSGTPISSLVRGNDTTPTAPGVTTQGTNRALLGEFFLEQFFGATAPPPTMVARADLAGWELADENVATASATGSRVLGGVPAATRYIAGLMALKPGTPTQPATPTGLTATAGAGQVTISFNANSETNLLAPAYQLQRKISGGTYVDVAFFTVAGRPTVAVPWIDTAVVAGFTYLYRLRVLSETGGSAYTADATATPTTPTPPAPGPGPTPPPPSVEPLATFGPAEYRPTELAPRILRPHLRWPLRVVSGQYEIVEQGSAEDIGQQVDVTLRTPRGAIPAVPDFGLPDQTFQPDQGAIDATIEKWVPDAAPTIETTIINPADTGSARIDVDVEDSGT
jgi:hypothetical protein